MNRVLHPARVVLTVWTLWYSTVVCTNATDLLRTFGVLPQDFTWVSHNFAMVVGSSGAEGAAYTAAVGVYLGGYLWQLVTTSLLWRALIAGWRHPERQRALARPALTLALGFWGAFMIMAELGTAKTVPLHLELFLAMAASLLISELVPEPTASRASAVGEAPEPPELVEATG